MNMSCATTADEKTSMHNSDMQLASSQMESELKEKKMKEELEARLE